MTSVAISKLSDDELLEQLREACFQSKKLLARIILLLIEVENRRLHLQAATPSPFEYCVRRLGMSEGEAYRRTKAARLVARFPQLLPYIERGDIHLTALVQLGDYFTEENIDDLVRMAKKKSKMEIAELVARLAPRPDVPARLRKLPQHDARTRLGKAPKPAIDPLSEGRYRLQVTGSRAFRDKLLRARDMMMHANPSGDLAVVVERALDELLEVFEKRIFGKLSRKEAPTQAHSQKAELSPIRSHAQDGEQQASLVPLRAGNRKQQKASANARRPGLARATVDDRAAHGKAGARREARITANRWREPLAPAQVIGASSGGPAQVRRASRRH